MKVTAEKPSRRSEEESGSFVRRGDNLPTWKRAPHCLRSRIQTLRARDVANTHAVHIHRHRLRHGTDRPRCVLPSSVAMNGQSAVQTGEEVPGLKAPQRRLVDQVFIHFARRAQAGKFQYLRWFAGCRDRGAPRDGLDPLRLCRLGRRE